MMSVRGSCSTIESAAVDFCKHEFHRWRIECSSSWACSHRRYYFEFSGGGKRAMEILKQHWISQFRCEQFFLCFFLT